MSAGATCLHPLHESIGAQLEDGGINGIEDSTCDDGSSYSMLLINHDVTDVGLVCTIIVRNAAS